MEKQEKVYTVSGMVTGRKGLPVREARVVIWWQHMRDREELASGATSEQGKYSIRYKVPTSTTQPILLEVEALSEHLDAPLLSPLTQAQQKLVVNLAYESPDQSEWTKLVRGIEPQLHGVKLSDLVENSTHQDLSFLAKELNTNEEVIMRVAVSARLETAFQIPAPAVYAFLRQQIPAALPSTLLDASQSFALIDPLVQSVASMIFGLSSATQTQTITSAIALDYIGAQYTRRSGDRQRASAQAHRRSPEPAILGRQHNTRPAARRDSTFRRPSSRPLRRPSPRTAFPCATSGAISATESRTHGGGSFHIERTLSVGAFVKNFTPLMQNLLQGFAAGMYQTLPDLARLSLKDWENLVDAAGAPPSIDAAGTATPAQVFASCRFMRASLALIPQLRSRSRMRTATLVPAAAAAAAHAVLPEQPEPRTGQEQLAGVSSRARARRLSPACQRNNRQRS